MSCEGCTQEVIRQREQKNITIQKAINYAKEKNVVSVVYFDGKKYQYGDESYAITIIGIQIVGRYLP